jgi:MoaA/NifB/PqqE/SkfB family radical SAM enzyme
MCDIPGRTSEVDSDTVAAMSIIDQTAALGAGGISFTGGEPLLRSDIFELLAHARKKGLETILVTNGILINKYIDDIIKARPSVINVSIDGATAAVHDASRGMPGAFDTVTRNVSMLSTQLEQFNTPTELVASCVISDNNTADLDAIIRLCKGIGFNRIIFCPLHYFSRGSSSLPIIPESTVGSFLRHHKERSFIDNSDYYFDRLDLILRGSHPPVGCTAGYTTLIIDHAGNVYPCKSLFEIRQPLGKLTPQGSGLKEIWHGESFNQFRKSVKLCTKCYMTINREFDGLFL